MYFLKVCQLLYAHEKVKNNVLDLSTPFRQSTQNVLNTKKQNIQRSTSQLISGTNSVTNHKCIPGPVKALFSTKKHPNSEDLKIVQCCQTIRTNHDTDISVPPRRNSFEYTAGRTSTASPRPPSHPPNASPRPPSHPPNGAEIIGTQIRTKNRPYSPKNGVFH